MIEEGTVVAIYPKTNKGVEFLQKYNARKATVTYVNPIAGYKGYEVSIWDFDETINVDIDEAVEANR